MNSVLAQSYQNFKLFVIDDGSTDHTQQVLQKYSAHPNIHFLKQENKGVSAARNLGIQNSSSPWLAFLDSDDEWLEDKLEEQISFLSRHPQCRFVHSNEIWIRNGVRVNAPKKFDKSHRDIFQRSLETCLISPSTVLMRRDLCLEQGCFDESFVICEDYELWLKILLKEEIGFISKNLIKKHGGHDDQLSTKYLAMDFWRVKALVKLLDHPDCRADQKKWVDDQIEKKCRLLKAGYLKHQNHQSLEELLSLYPKARDL